MKMPRISPSPPGDSKYSPLDDAINAGVPDLFLKGDGTVITIQPPGRGKIRWERNHSSNRTYSSILLRRVLAGIVISLAGFALIYVLRELVNKLPHGSPAQSLRETMLDLEGEFVKFEAKYAKEWGSAIERENRKAIFTKNYLKAQRLDASHGGGGGNRSSNARFGVNALADMSDVEFKEVGNTHEHSQIIRTHSRCSCPSTSSLDLECNRNSPNQSQSPLSIRTSQAPHPATTHPTSTGASVVWSLL